MKKEQKVFHRTLFGYSKKDVQAYLDGIIKKISALSLAYREKEEALLLKKGELENQAAALSYENAVLLKETRRQEMELSAVTNRLEEAQKQRQDLEKQLSEQALLAQAADEKLRQMQDMQAKMLAASSLCKSVLGAFSQNCQSLKEDLEQMENALGGAYGETDSKNVLPFKEKIV